MHSGGDPAPSKKSNIPTSEDGERTRRAVVEAALRLFAGRGFEAVSLREIAREVGVAHNIVRYHFRSKPGVWRAAADAAYARYSSVLRPVLDEAAEDEDTNWAAGRIMRGSIRASARHPEFVRMLLSQGASGG